ncbi:MAG: type II secretion system protein [Rhodoblastus sp.]|nr:MAG: type II secretion system protein [Rhodoblastus sp.]
MIKRLRSQRGFLLVEALAAFAILSLAMSALFAATSQAVKTDQRAEFERSPPASPAPSSTASISRFRWAKDV